MSAKVTASWSFVAALLVVGIAGESALYWINERNAALADHAFALCTKPAGPVAKMQARFYIPHR